MPSFFIYLLKANIALTVCYLAYRFGLRRLTFYTLNRFFLLFGILFSAAFPLVDMNSLLNGHKALAGRVTYYAPDWDSLRQALHPQYTFGWWDLLQYVFWAGVTVMTIRFIIQLLSLLRIHRRSHTWKINGEKIRLMEESVNSFSFFANIYVNPSLHAEEDLQAIIIHEKVHVTQWHTADIMAGEVNNIFYWFNPGAWLMKSAIRENLEFITDRKILLSGMDARTYQYSLVNVSRIPYAASLANNFNFSHLKQRIMMMNKKRSSRVNFLRYVVLMPVMAGIILLIFTNSRGQKHAVINGTAAILNPDTVQVLKKIPKGYHFNNKGYAIEVMETSGITKVIDRSGDVFGPFDLYSFTKEQLEAFNRRFGSTGTYEGLLRLKGHATFLKSHSEVMDYFWKDKRHILILLGTGKSRIYDLTNPDDHREFIEKYGTVPPEQRLLIENPDKPAHDSTIMNNPSLPKDYSDFLKRNPAVNGLKWSTPENGMASVVIVIRKDRNVEKYHLNNNNEMKTATAKYGNFPRSPAPPPAARVYSVPPLGSQKSVASPATGPHGHVQFSPSETEMDSIPKPKPPHLRSKAYFDFLNRNPSVRSLSWRGVPNERATIVELLLKDGYLEKYHLNNAAEMGKAKSKYGEFPPAPVILKNSSKVKFTPPRVWKDSVPGQTHQDTGRYEGILIRGTDGQNHSHADTVRLKGVMVKGVDNQNPPLLILNDKIIPEAKLKEMDPNQIASITVLKDEKAVTGYGDKGRNGVIIITTKDRNNAPQAKKNGRQSYDMVVTGYPITVNGKQAETHTDEYVFRSNMTDEEISRMKDASLKKSKIKMEVTSINRDPSTKLITDISVKATDLETGSTASFSDASGSKGGILGVVSKTWDKKMKVEAFGAN